MCVKANDKDQRNALIFELFAGGSVMTPNQFEDFTQVFGVTLMPLKGPVTSS